MSDALRLLELIESGLVEHGGDLGGWTRLADDALQVFDGRATLRAEVKEDGPAGREGLVHAHVLATLHEHDDETLDACLFGMGDDREGALRQATLIWITAVAGPIRSFLDDRPVCTTCRAGVPGGDPQAGEVEGDYGLPGLRAFVGPSVMRGIEEVSVDALDDAKPWFRYAAEAAAPRRVHLAKSTVLSRGDEGWRREMEIDGHDAAVQDPDWPAGARGPDIGYATRYAVFEFPAGSPELERRAELDRTIRHFAAHYARHETVDALMDAMAARGFDPDLVHQAEAFSTIAFGRAYFEPHGVRYADTVIRARRDGRVEPGVPLASIPAYARAKALAGPLAREMSEEDFRALCFYNAESNAILQGIEAAGPNPDLTQFQLRPCVVPDRGVDDATMRAALAAQGAPPGRVRRRGKPWWKFW